MGPASVPRRYEAAGDPFDDLVRRRAWGRGRILRLLSGVAETPACSTASARLFCLTLTVLGLGAGQGPQVLIFPARLAQRLHVGPSALAGSPFPHCKPAAAAAARRRAGAAAADGDFCAADG